MSKRTVRSWIARQAQRKRICFTIEELEEAFPNTTPSIRKHGLIAACKGGALVHAWQGLYLLVPREYRETRAVPPVEYIGELMAYLGKPYCVALLDAAAFYGVARPENGTPFAVMTSTPRPRCTIEGGVPVEFISKREMAGRIAPSLVRSMPTKNGSVVVSSPEYTVCTLVQHAIDLGGLASVVPVIQGLMPSCDFGKLPPSLKRYVPQTCLQRLGFILERVLGNAEAAERLYRFMRPARTPFTVTKLVPNLPMAQCPFDERWCISVNEDLAPVHPQEA